MTDVVNVYIYSIILQILMNMVVHVEAFESGLVSRVRACGSLSERVVVFCFDACENYYVVGPSCVTTIF